MKILIVDDTKIPRMLITNHLEEIGIKKKDIIDFSSPIKAIEFIENNEIKVIFTDVNMPEMNGLDFLKKVFKILNKDNLTTFVISGTFDKNIKKSFNDIGVKLFLSKKTINNKYFKEYIKEKIKIDNLEVK